MRALLSTYGSRGDVEPMVGLAVQLGALGAEVRACAPSDFAELLGRCRRAAGADGPAGDQGDDAVGGGSAPARGRGM